MVEPAQVVLDLDELTAQFRALLTWQPVLLSFIYLSGEKNLNDSVKFGIFYKTNFASIVQVLQIPNI